MTGEWSGDLEDALASGDPQYMQAMLARVPPALLAQTMAALEEAAQAAPANAQVRAALSSLGLAKPQSTTDGFDPALLADCSMPPSLDSQRVDGVRQLLLRYSGQISPSNAIARLADPAWLAAWDRALPALAGQTVLFAGSELGVLAIRALHHGAARVRCAEQHALDARIAGGMVQKHLLTCWRAHYGDAVQAWSEEQRRASFETYAAAIDVEGPGTAAGAAAQWLAFPNLDHTLLGTGIVPAVRKHGAAQVLPARAKVFAMGVQWNYPGAEDARAALAPLRWSPGQQALDLDASLWAARTGVVEACSIDFCAFVARTVELHLPVIGDGQVDAIVFWFELELGQARFSSAPGGGCIKPAVQYTDGSPVYAGASLPLRLHIGDTRLYFETMPAATLVRKESLPGWCAAQLADTARSGAFRAAIGAALGTAQGQLVLDVGAGCGVTAAAAEQLGAEQVVACETNAALARVAQELAQANAGRIDVVRKECRQLAIPADLPRRADVAVFENFDCSLIGEGILHFAAHAREHLLAPGARVIPAQARIRAMLIEYRFDKLLDVDCALLNPYRASPTCINVDAAKLGWRALSAPVDVFAFDFATAGPDPQEQALALSATSEGTASAILFWFDLGFGSDTWLSNSPLAGEAAHWKQGIHFLPELRVESGMAVPILARHNGSRLSFQWQTGAIPAQAFSRLPMCDPRWLAAAAELEQQAGSLLEHCARHAEERDKVRAIALRMAVDPAAHGVDPLIAQRFAAMMLASEAGQ